MTRLTLVTLVLASLTWLIGCGHHKRHHHRRGVADSNSGSITVVHTGSVAFVDTTSIAGTTISFQDSLSDADRLWLIDQIRQEFIAWEIENGERIENITIDIVVTNNIDTDVLLELVEGAICIGCKDEVGPHNLPPGILKKLLDDWHDQYCGHHDHEEDDD